MPIYKASNYLIEYIYIYSWTVQVYNLVDNNLQEEKQNKQKKKKLAN